jgi:hypothetical protein
MPDITFDLIVASAGMVCGAQASWRDDAVAIDHASWHDDAVGA